MPRRKRLTDAGIGRLRPEPREYTVWDTRVRGLGVRVRPSGARTYIYYSKSATGTRKVSLGPVTLRDIEDIRRSCLAMAAAAVEARETVQDKPPLFREFVAGPWHSACYDRCKPSTQRVMRSALKRQLLPAFGAVRLDRISRIMVVRWFDAYSATAPGGANRVLDILRQILNHAAASGHIATNPARTIRRNRAAKLTRFLSREEIQRLHRVLDRHAERSESVRQQVDIIRLLAAHGLSQERNRAAVPAGGRWRPSQSGRQQDGSETGLPECAGAGHHRAADGAGRRPLGVPVSEQSNSSSGRWARALVHGEARGGHRRCSPA